MCCLPFTLQYSAYTLVIGYCHLEGINCSIISLKFYNFIFNIIRSKQILLKILS